LPGQEVPVGGIAAGFRKLWADTPAEESRAVQLNLVLHLGRNSSAADAVKQFQNTLAFARRYPARVVILCPDYDEKAPAEIRAKIYGECFFGKSKSDTRCVEFVILHYTMAVRQYLEPQVSVCLSTDLPMYYWAHAFADAARIGDYAYLLTRSTRVLVDSAVVPPETFHYPWPNRGALRDLAYTRTLPLRQNLGQFLSRYTPEVIFESLKGIYLRYQGDYTAEANCLLMWLRKGLNRSGVHTGLIDFRADRLPCDGTFSVHFDYLDSTKHFDWLADLGRNHAEFSGDLGTGRTTLTVGAHLLTPEMALAEAMFF
jgi:hypothetical protein